MNSLYNHAVKQSKSLKQDLAVFAEAPESAPLSLQGQISATLTAFSRTLQDYENATSNELNADKKKKCATRLANFRSELQESRDRFKQLKQLREDAVAHANRTELLGKRRHLAGSTTDGESCENPYTSNPAGASGGAPAMSRHDGLTHENNALANAGAQLDDFIQRGYQVLTDLADQKDMLKTTQRTMLGVASTLGLSGETIRLVERRARSDKVVFGAGVAVVFVCFYLIIRYVV